MLLECELCGAHYRADIADAHVEAGRLMFTCKSCGRDVVVVGNPSDRGPRDGVLLFDDQVDPPEGAGPAAGFAPAPEPEPAAPVLGAPPADVRAGEAAEGAGRHPVEAPAFGQPAAEGGDRGFLRIALGVGVLAAAAVLFVMFVLPMLSGPPTRETAAAAGGRRTPAPAETPAAAPAPSSAPAGPAAAPEPRAPVVEIRELAVPAAKPTPVPPPPRKESGPRDAAAVLDAASIQESVGRARPFYRLCAVTERRRDPDARLGTVNATVTIAPEGAVTRVVLDRPDIVSTPLGPCVSEALSKMTFPRFEGAPVVLRQPIDLDVPASR